MGRPPPLRTGWQRVRRCPAPGCEHAVEVLVDLGAEPLDVSCACGAAFCFQCKEEAHRPVRPARPSGAAPRAAAARRRWAAARPHPSWPAGNAPRHVYCPMWPACRLIHRSVLWSTAEVLF